MKIVVLERNSVGTDVPVDCYKDFGEVTCYRNTLAEDAPEKVKEFVESIVPTYHPAGEHGTEEKPKAYQEQLEAMATK